MGVCFHIVNRSKREVVLFMHIGAAKRLELAGNPVAAAIGNWYFLTRAGDDIAYVPDDGTHWPFADGFDSDSDDYEEVTDRIVDELIDAGILVDNGREIFDEDEPDVYIRRLDNVWMD